MTAWNFKDLTGMKFGRLTVIERAENRNNRVHWNCICECGNTCSVMSKHLISGHTRSCGCLNNFFNRAGTHKMTNTAIYQTWSDIKKRCFNPNCECFKNYGGRGITICDEWKNNFVAFYDYVSKLEHFGEEGYTLDRIDNNGNYEPNNLRWANWKTQCGNTRRNHFVEYNGEKILITHAAAQIGISATALRARIKKGDTGERLFRPAEHSGRSIKKSRQ